MNKMQLNKYLKIGHLNVRSLFTGFQNFVDLVIDSKFDIMCVSETWLNQDISADIVHIPNFKFLHKARSSRGGGVGLYIRNDLACKEIFNDFSSVDGLEYIMVEVNIGKILIMICVIYRTPSSDVITTVTHIDNLLSFITPQYDNIFILGDINIDQTYDNILLQSMSAYDFSPYINEPTRITSTTEKIIDVLFANCTDFITNSGTIPADLISDHHAIFCEVNISVSRTTPKIVRYRDFKNFSRDSFYQDLRNICWDDIFYINNLEEKVTFIANNILYLFDTHAPYVSARITKSYAPWLTDTIKQIMSERNKALNNYKRTKNIGDWINYKKLRNLCVTAFRREKLAYLEHYQKNARSKDFWRAINNLNIKQKHYNDIPVHLRDVDGINKYFSSVYSPPDNCPDTVNQYNSGKYSECLSFHFTFASTEQIQDIILNLKSNAAGSDQVSALMLKLCLPIISHHITHVVNCCLEVGYFPNEWKLSLIKPLAKVKNPENFSDLRPITIISAISKVLEKTIQQQIYDYVTENKIISDLQSGFRKKYSTTTTLANITDHLLYSLDKGHASILVLLDFSKAFDTLDHTLLCAKLAYFGFDTISVNFFRSYLTNRRQIVNLEDQYSNTCSITSGVPQGSVLGPILYLLYTADIFDCVNHMKIQSFADDTQLLYSFDYKTIDTATKNVSGDLDSLTKYSKNHNLRLNANKSAVIYFASNAVRDALKRDLKFSLGGEPLPVVTQAKNLGLILDNNLRFKDHVTGLLKKSYTMLRLLYRNIYILNFKLRKKLCETLVLPILSYCNIIYFPCLDKFTQYRIQKVQNSCCRFVFKLRKYDHVSQKINELGWLKMQSLYKYNLSVFVHNIISSSVPAYLREKFVFARNIHKANLRSKEKLSLPKYRTTMFRRSFSYNSISLYNNLDDSLKFLPVNKFRIKVKQQFLSRQWVHL